MIVLIVRMILKSLTDDTHFPVSTDIENKQQFKSCFTVSGVKLPVGYFVGVSAATGDLSDNHDIISLKMFDLSTPDDVRKYIVFL